MVGWRPGRVHWDMQPASPRVHQGVRSVQGERRRQYLHCNGQRRFRCQVSCMIAFVSVAGSHRYSGHGRSSSAPILVSVRSFLRHIPSLILFPQPFISLRTTKVPSQARSVCCLTRPTCSVPLARRYVALQINTNACKMLTAGNIAVCPGHRGRHRYLRRGGT